MGKKVLITGVLGQDGSYLAQHALAQGCEVLGGVRGEVTPERRWRLDHLGIGADVRFIDFDLMAPELIRRQIGHHRPDLIFNLAAQSSVGDSFNTPVATAEAGGMGALHIFEVARHADWQPRVFQASSSEIFGELSDAQQSEAYRVRYGTFVSSSS